MAEPPLRGGSAIAMQPLTRHALRVCAMYLGCVVCLTCDRSVGAPPKAAIEAKSMGSWVFAGTDGTAVTANDMRGRMTIVLFMSTYDPASQIAATRFDHCIHTLPRRTNAIAVAMEPPDNAVLVATFHDSLKLSYPMLMPDPATLVGQGPFGVIDVVPTWVVLDPYGREVWRGFGVRALSELGDTVSKLEDAARGRSHGCS